MPLLQWENCYSVNNVKLDNDHKKLINIFNDLYDNCSDSCDLEIILKGIIDLEYYAISHFRSEELYMEDIGYEDIDQHVLEHRKFEVEIANMKDKIYSSDTQLCREVIEYLWNWLLNHVIKEDMKYAFYSQRMVP